jgi:hypothetical protein
MTNGYQFAEVEKSRSAFGDFQPAPGPHATRLQGSSRPEVGLRCIRFPAVLARFLARGAVPKVALVDFSNRPNPNRYPEGPSSRERSP